MLQTFICCIGEIYLFFRILYMSQFFLSFAGLFLKASRVLVIIILITIIAKADLSELLGGNVRYLYPESRTLRQGLKNEREANFISTMMIVVVCEYSPEQNNE